MANLTAEEIAAVAKTVELIERTAYDQDRHLAAEVRAWLKGKL